VTRPQAARDTSLDALRGLDVLLMLLVNFQVATGPAQLRHAAWDGMTLADVVFPVFLLIVGMSAALASDGGRRPGVGAILRRTVLLFATGLALNLLLNPSLDPAMLRWSGVLQRIAIVYLACALLARLSRGSGLPLLLAGLLLAGHSLALLLLAAPGEARPLLGAGQGISGWLDRQLLPGRLLRTSWDPEGVLSTVPAIASGLIGLALIRLGQRPCDWRAPALLSAAMLVLGLVAAGLGLPLNKNLWTASFVLVTSGLGGLAWIGMRFAWPSLRTLPLAGQLVAAGQAALMLYMIHMLVIVVLRLPAAAGQTIWATLVGLFGDAGLAPAPASLAFALTATILCWLAMLALLRRGIVLKF
jgi:predicted acyltransferase